MAGGRTASPPSRPPCCGGPHRAFRRKDAASASIRSCARTRSRRAQRASGTITGSGDSTIQGFATEISVAPAETQQFKIDTNAQHLHDRHLSHGVLRRRRRAARDHGHARRRPSAEPAQLPRSAGDGSVDCGNWAVSASWHVPADAVSGIYFAKLTRLDTGGASHIFFVVRDDTRTVGYPVPDVRHDVAGLQHVRRQQPLRGRPRRNPGRAYKVSYNRPFNTRDASPEDFVFNAEYPMVRWLERNGYDVSYTSGVDTDRVAAELLEHHVFLSVGHDEYWSGAAARQRRSGARRRRQPGVPQRQRGVLEDALGSRASTARTRRIGRWSRYKETHANAMIDPAAADLDRHLARPAIQPARRRRPARERADRHSCSG